MTLWMIWAVAVTGAMAVAALAVESILRDRGWQSRWVWVAALGGSFGLQVWSRVGTTEPKGLPEWLTSSLDASSGLTVAAELSALSRLTLWLGERTPFADLLGAFQTTATAGRISWMDGVVATAWPAATGLMLFALLVGLWRLHTRVRTWERVRIEREDVVLSEDFGPALVGVWRPLIVVPRWVLGLSPEERRLALLHEVEHRSARDTLLLLIGSLAAALNPWNLVMWWVVVRLRQAVEVDCDRRVLRAGATPASYGTLLIDLSAASGRLRLPVAALAHNKSLLERRLTMMTRVNNRAGAIRVAGTLAVAVLLIVAACDTPAPSVLGPDDPDVGVAEETAAVAARVGESPMVRAFTGSGEDSPLVYVDGIRVEPSTIPDLAPDEIERIEVLKGAASIELYGEEGRNGVIQIFTKAAEARVDVRDAAPTTPR